MKRKNRANQFKDDKRKGSKDVDKYFEVEKLPPVSVDELETKFNQFNNMLTQDNKKESIKNSYYFI